MLRLAFIDSASYSFLQSTLLCSSFSTFSSINLISRKKINKMPLSVLYIVVVCSRLMFPFLDLVAVMSYFAVASDFPRHLKPNRSKKKREFRSQDAFLLKSFLLLFHVTSINLLLAIILLKDFLFFWWVSPRRFLRFRRFKKCQNPFFSSLVTLYETISILHHPPFLISLCAI